MLWLRAVLFILLVQVTVVAVVPFFLAPRGLRFDPGALRPAGAAFVAGGVLLLLICNALFVREGRGTAAPYDPPRELVVRGPYRHVRNPMYLGALLIVAGQGFWRGSVPVLGYGGVLAVAYHLFVRYYEEPRLAALFGAPYRRYLETVPRWRPRIHPYRSSSA